MTRSGEIEGGDRLFTLSKLIALMGGIKKLIGGSQVRKDLLTKIESINDTKERLILMVLALSESQNQQVELFLKALLQNKNES